MNQHHKLITIISNSKSIEHLMGFTYDCYANRWRMCSISYYFRNSSASINNVTNVNYDIDLQKMYMYSCKMPQMLCLTRWLTMRREFLGRQGNTTWFARHIMTSQGHRLLSVGIIMLDVFQCWLNKKFILFLLKEWLL
jgi:hypothetical protein